MALTGLFGPNSLARRREAAEKERAEKGDDTLGTHKTVKARFWPWLSGKGP